MGRYTGSVCKQCRRERTKLYLKGERCDTDRCSMERRGYPPGEHGRRRVRESDYLIQIREKQKARRVYGVMERQFRTYYQRALQEKGITGENLLRLLESRLDNTLYRAGLAASRKQARQLVSHGHVMVNEKKVDIPSCQVKEGDVIGIASGSRELGVFKEAAQGPQREQVPWLQVDRKKMAATVVESPGGYNPDVEIRDEMIVELYSR
ncbi:MAG: 30S ribosomal protein S4 [Actinomycetia bacterium]|nr:30S ribosomal protein S4 [Actinomycetota bacterium]MBU4239984.1 30S ribosomal protein S4 [Actinomycetota bacterium]MBU4301178.1 30S ribosomal protein S4 [Actinomycetota bacterium]MCG2796033.1 30S ribosomal protein S4 [Actinomycetes bacterium]